MPLILFHRKYIKKGTQAILADGGTKRKAAICILIESVGGTYEAVYFGMNSDAYAIAKLPDTEATTFVNLTWNATGQLDVDVVLLLMPVKFDKVSDANKTTLSRSR